MKCPNCNAGLEIDIEHLQAYCPYCGTKLSFDFDKLNEIMLEKEKTKQIKIVQDSEVSKEKIGQLSEIFKSQAGCVIAGFLGLGSIILLISCLLKSIF